MNDKKNLDRLFQEKFKDFEVEPDELVWKNIESALKGNQKKRKVIPLWYRLSGIAAALLIGAFIANSVLDSDVETPKNSIVSDEKKDPNPIQDANGVAAGTDPENIPARERSVTETKAGVDNETNRTGSKKNRNANPGDAVVSSQKEAAGSTPGITPKTRDGQNAVAAQSGKKAGKNRIGASPSEAGSQNAIAAADRKTATKGKRAKAAADLANGSDTRLADSDVKETTQTGSSGLAENAGKNQETAVTGNQNGQKDIFQNSTNPIAASGNTALDGVESKNLDSAAVATAEPNALEELLKENEKEKNVIAEAKLNRWQITPQIAPIYFGSTTNGSPIDDQFSNNDKRYDRNLSYGVAVNYAVSKRFNVRTGVNKLTLGYDTNDVIFAAGLQSSTFQNISPSGNSTVVQILSADMTAGLLPFESSLQGIKAGSISQRMGYIEVPMELSYKLVDDKFGINLIGGISTLFLDENEVSITATDVNASLGKANNLNDVHFSSNFGVGFKYSFTKSLEFNFEPTLKYQINTFSRNAGDFKPYFLGLYSGISFKF